MSFAPSLLFLSRRFHVLRFPQIQLRIHNRRSRICSRLSCSNSSSLSHSISLPSQLGQLFHVVAVPGITDSEFRTAIDSSLFKQWLKTIQSETGVLVNGSMSLRKVLIQVVECEVKNNPELILNY